MLELTDIEARVLGCLIEKQIATPDYYPLTLNSLVTACNQKSNRNPHMACEDKVVLRTLDNLREKKVASLIHQAGSRVPKYAHHADEILSLSLPELVVMCELLLRGPQTTGELRSHCNRLYPFGDLREIADVIQTLVERNEGTMVRQLPRQSGRKESRYAQLLTGEPEIDDTPAATPHEPVRVELEVADERVDALTLRVEALEQELASLKETFETFRQQFE